MSMKTVLMVILLFMVAMIGGCEDKTEPCADPHDSSAIYGPSNAVGVPYSDLVIERPVWGKGELPAEHQGFFGNDNTARLDYVQNRVLDKHAAILKIIAIRVLALEAVDPNAMRLEALEVGMKRLVR